jgi:hypothetical protein
VTDAEYDRDSNLVAADLARLKEVMETKGSSHQRDR